MKDYYKTLGVEKNASAEDIKKAFRKLAHQYHPDKTKNDPASAQKFKEASEAYSVLSDQTKRANYDRFGSAGPGMGGGAGGYGGFDPNNMGGFDFSGFANGQGGVEFDLGDIFGDIFGGGRRTHSRQQRGEDISVDIEMSFEESIFGVERDITVSKMAQCLTCHGNGAEPGSGLDTCKTCHGKGIINEQRRSFMGVFNTQRVCDTCHGRGQIPKKPCHTCHGKGIHERQQEFTVKMPAGIENGEMVRLSGMGEAVASGAAGDMYVRAHVKSHPYIRKQGQDLVSDLKIKLTDAIAGADVPFKALGPDGEIAIVIPEGTNTGDVLRVRGKGVPNDRNKRGDLLVRIAVDMPKKLSKTARKAVEELRSEGL
ncbi:MAG TPA: molecular chaperone DnaJ [Candidatus Paceibacterota bacterium]